MTLLKAAAFEKAGQFLKKSSNYHDIEDSEGFKTSLVLRVLKLIDDPQNFVSKAKFVACA